MFKTRFKFKKAKNSTRLTAYIYMVINTLTWGAALIIVKPALDVTTPYRFLLYRYALAAFLALPIVIYFWKKTKPKLKNLIQVGLIELLGTTLTLWILYTGLQKTGGIEASLLNTTQPLFITLIGVSFFREKLEKHERLGLTTAFVGTLFLTLLPVFNHTASLEKITITGNLLVIISLILNGLYYPLTKKYYKRLPKIFASSLSFYVGLISFALLSLAEAGGSVTNLIGAIQLDLLDTSVVFASAYMAIFGSIIGYTALMKGMEVLEASEASLFNYLQPLVYLSLGKLWLGEGVSTMQILALVIILAGVFAAERLNYKKSR